MNQKPIKSEAPFVLYWMIAARRPRHNFALERALELARELEKPLLVLEAVSASYRWASLRLHRFLIEGMAANRHAFSQAGVAYYPYVEPRAKAGHGLVEALSERAAAIVTDEFPCFFLPRLLRGMAPRLAARLEAVDGNGILPLRAADRAYQRAFDFRRFAVRVLPEHLAHMPVREPLRRARSHERASVPRAIEQRWPRASDDLLSLDAAALAALPIDASVCAGAASGGYREGERRLKAFVAKSLAPYALERNHPDAHATSELSPYLHFGHLSAHEVLATVLEAEGVRPDTLERAPRDDPKKFWQMSGSAEAFLDQLIVWRELGYNFAFQRPQDYDRYSALPDWARQTLAKHASDPREQLYSAAQLENAETADALWNAAQRELVQSGAMHNYLRMLWGKRVLGWCREPSEAYELLVHLNNKYALDGRNPNSYSGISWCFGRYDRPWGPERPVFGLVRYMTSESARRKLHLSGYLERWGISQTPRLPGF